MVITVFYTFVYKQVFLLKWAKGSSHNKLEPFDNRIKYLSESKKKKKKKRKEKKRKEREEKTRKNLKGRWLHPLWQTKIKGCPYNLESFNSPVYKVYKDNLLKGLTYATLLHFMFPMLICQ